MCGTCRCLNLAHRDECGSCRRANPRGPRPTAITASTRGKDVLKCSDDEVIGFMQEKQQPNLQRCYQEIGIRVGAGRVVSDEDTPRRILNAFKQRGEERMLRLINVVSDPGVFYECSTHFLGNYGMQSLVEATLLIRKALAEAEAEGQHPLQSFRESHDGRDPHGVLLYAALPHAMELSTDERANYIVQKLADYATPLELVDMCGTLFPQGPSLAQNHKGVHVMKKLIMAKKLISADGHHGAGLGGRGGGRFGGRGQHQQQAHVTPAPPATFDASFFAEGLFDPAAPVQASSGADGWAAALDGTDPWAASTGTDGWAAAPEPANAQPRQQAQQPAAAATHVGHAAGLAILQSLQTQQQQHQQQHSHAPAGVAAAASAPAHPQPQPQPVMVPPLVVSAASAASYSSPVAVQRPHPLLAVNPALAAARALHQQNHASANGPASPGQPHIVTRQIVTPTVVHVTPQVHNQQPQQYQQQPQQYQLQPQYTSAGVAPPAAALPRPNLGFPMALFNPAMAVLNNTAGIAAFAPRGPHVATAMAAPRPVTAVPVAVPMPQPMTAAAPHEVPVAVPLNSMPPPQPSATLMAFARSAPVNGPVTTTSSAAAVASARAAPRPAAQPQAPPPPPLPPPAGAPAPGGW